MSKNVLCDYFPTTVHSKMSHPPAKQRGHEQKHESLAEVHPTAQQQTSSKHLSYIPNNYNLNLTITRSSSLV